MKPDQAEAVGKNIAYTTDYSEFENADLVIEAAITHFFAPAWRNPAVEVIAWDEVDRRVVDYLNWMFCVTGKVPITRAIQEAPREPSFTKALQIGYRAFGEMACTKAAREGISAFLDGRTVITAKAMGSGSTKGTTVRRGPSCRKVRSHEPANARRLALCSNPSARG